MIYPEIIKDLLRYKEQINENGLFNWRISDFTIYRYFFKWRYFKTQTDPFLFKIPWITFPAIRKLERFIRKDMIVFEYGCGGSTLFFAEKVNYIISIEHDPHWYISLSQRLKAKNINNVSLFLREPVANPNAEKIFTSENNQFEDFSFESYVTAIENYPDKFFDVILIDGRARNGCFKASCCKIREGGIIILDNTERERYRTVINDAGDEFSILELPGPTPYSKTFTKTTLFIKN